VAITAPPRDWAHDPWRGSREPRVLVHWYPKLPPPQ